MTDRQFKYYNDSPDIIFKEYGRNVHKMALHLLEIEDKERRTQMAFALIELMRRLNPNGNANDSEEEQQKLWDHLFIMSGFRLDVNCPYPMPEESILERKMVVMPYPKSNARFKHYGHNLDLLVKEIVKLDDDEARENGIIYLGRLMKSLYGTWNKEGIDDDLILDQLDMLSKGQLKISRDKVAQNRLFDSSFKEWRSLPAGAIAAGNHHSGRTFIKRSNVDKRRKK
jgi:Domain of unknown function (DUF4290)